MNLGITLITALTTGQAVVTTADKKQSQLGTNVTRAFLGDGTTVDLGIIAFLLSILNTFFRPHQKMSSHGASRKTWAGFGATFEEQVYKADASDTAKLRAVQELLNKTNTYKNSQEFENNFLTDLLYILTKPLRTEEWIKNIDVELQEQFDMQDGVRAETHGSTEAV
jgi:hypothetical protein